jgi:hypothetical protein
MSRYAELRERAEKAEAKIKQQEFFSWLSSDEMRTKASPAIKAELNEILEFAATIESFEFSAPDPTEENKTVKVKQAPVEKIKMFMQRHLPDIITFGELATKKAAGGAKTNMEDAQEIAAKAVEFQKAEAAAGRTITVTEAVNSIMQKA